MSTTPPQVRWTGDMLDRPEVMAAFCSQTRRQLNGFVEYVAAIRRDAEAMWDANPPEGYNTFESWWRERWVKGPFTEIQAHLEAAAALTHKLEARYRKGRHEIPAKKAAARSAKQAGPALGPGGPRPAAPRPAAPRPVRPAETTTSSGSAGSDFMDLIRGKRPA